MRRCRRLIMVASAAVGSLLLACSSSSEKSPGAAPTIFEGNLDETSCTQIAGWVWDRKRPDVPLNVKIFAGSTPVATLIADLLRDDLVRAGKGSGRHSFRFVVPDSLKNDQTHEVRVFEAGENFELSHSPQPLKCPSK